MTIDNEIRAAVDKATAAATRMVGTTAAHSAMVGRQDDAHAASRRTTILDDPETVLDRPVSVGNGRALVSAATLADATFLADVADAKSLVSATFAVVAVGDGFVVVPAWSVPTNAVLYRTGP